MDLDNKHNLTNEDTSGQYHINVSNPGNPVVFVKEYKKHDSQESLNFKKDNSANVCEPIPGCSHWKMKE